MTDEHHVEIRPFRIEITKSDRTFFECECGRLLTLADREDEPRTSRERLVGRPQ